MFSAKLTAKILGLDERRIEAQASRVGLKKRYGKTYLRSLPDGLSAEQAFDLPIDQHVAAENRLKNCPTMRERFGILIPFVADRKTHSSSRARRLARLYDDRWADIHYSGGSSFCVH